MEVISTTIIRELRINPGDPEGEDYARIVTENGKTVRFTMFVNGMEFTLPVDLLLISSVIDAFIQDGVTY